MNEQAGVLVTIEELTEALPGKVNGMAVSSALGILRRHGIIERFDVEGSRMRGTRLLKHASRPDQLGLDGRGLKMKRDRDEDKLRRLIQFAYAKTCRQQWILEYFGDSDSHECGQCDRCHQSSVERRALNDEEIVIVKKALSGVARMSRQRSRHVWEPRYGRDRVIKCLVGSQAKTITEPGLDRLTTWGILKNMGARFIGELLDKLEEAGCVCVTEGEYPLLALTETGSRVMFGEKTPRLAWPEAPPSAEDLVGEPDEALYEALVKLRDDLRRQRGNVPAYTIFPNTVLRQLAALKPATAEEAMAVKGVGPQKARTLLPSFLGVIAAHRREFADA